MFGQNLLRNGASQKRFHADYVFYPLHILHLVNHGADIIGRSIFIQKNHMRGGNIEVLTKAGILLQPVLVVALKSVDLSVLKAEKGHSAVHFIVVFHIVYAIVLRQSTLQRKIEGIIGGVPDSEDIDSVFMKLNAEIAVVYREMR